MAGWVNMDEANREKREWARQGGDWYVISSRQSGEKIEIRVVAGPLPRGAAETEAQHRVNRQPEGYRVSVVEFDAFFGL